ncbi:hypothetical protein [Pseudobacter ginsenosidimutans]|uniref:Uncharacterized protein n=1 Tax=Pseudobacter ginsenosidimutans TaxID=661488 RepID=A0A4Q7MQG8_9BACT|nr:hypothetical protein [Pseudobacter ginsenosidimutans]QEC40414.1 hypothetical protein FSB84_01405 [Pseudobacter ginsenosidimutans]RZS68979.1 hypothetical protein EV199_4803 [Pseudobacter ginsenosidimutans]
MKFSKLSITICIIIFLVGCSKTGDYTPVSSGAKNSLLNPPPPIFANAIGQYEGYLQIITTNPSNQSALAVVNATLSEIKYAALVKHNIDLELEFGTDNIGILLFGLLEVAKERHIQGGGTIGTYDQFPAPEYYLTPSGDPMDCVLSAISAVIGIADAKALYRSVLAGASRQTVIAAVKLIGRRVATVVNVAIMVYNVIKCFWPSVEEPPPPPPLVSSPTPNPNPGSGSGAGSGFSYIPHSFFNSDREFFDQHKNDIINYLMTKQSMSQLVAEQVVEMVYTCGGDPAVIGTAWVEDYFSEAGSYDDGPVPGPGPGPGGPPNP